MKCITRKPEIKLATDQCLRAYREQGVPAFVKELNTRLLQAKVKFPMLEYASEIIFEHTNKSDHVAMCDAISKLQTIGGNVVIGILLKLHLTDHLEPTLHLAAKYISEGTEWYVADIIGERVVGGALLQDADETLKVLWELRGHPSNLVVRSFGAGTHLALKRGLNEHAAEQCFKLLLSLANTKDHQIKRGIGWAAKTTAKFYPGIIERHDAQISDATNTGQWFRTKVSIGLARNAYVKAGRG